MTAAQDGAGRDELTRLAAEMVDTARGLERLR